MYVWKEKKNGPPTADTKWSKFPCNSDSIKFRKFSDFPASGRGSSGLLSDPARGLPPTIITVFHSFFISEDSSQLRITLFLFWAIHIPASLHLRCIFEFVHGAIYVTRTRRGVGWGSQVLGGKVKLIASAALLSRGLDFLPFPKEPSQYSSIVWHSQKITQSVHFLEPGSAPCTCIRRPRKFGQWDAVQIFFHHEIRRWNINSNQMLDQVGFP